MQCELKIDWQDLAPFLAKSRWRHLLFSVWECPRQGGELLGKWTVFVALLATVLQLVHADPPGTSDVRVIPSSPKRWHIALCTAHGGIWETEAGRSGVQGHYQWFNEFQDQKEQKNKTVIPRLGSASACPKTSYNTDCGSRLREVENWRRGEGRNCRKEEVSSGSTQLLPAGRALSSRGALKNGRARFP